jgi:hypothetical protein
MDKEISETQCSCCFKEFSNKHNKKKHEQTSKCFVKNVKLEEDKMTKLEEELKLAKIQIEKNIILEEKVKELEILVKSGAIGSTTNSNNNTTNNIQNNIHVNMFGKENMSHITDEKILMIINKGFRSVPAYILLKHFSNDMLENSNVCNSNIKSPYLFAYNGTKWELKGKKDLISEMYGINFDELGQKFYEFNKEKRIKETSVEAFLRYLNEVYKDEVVDIVAEDINKLLYNERDKSIKNKKNK